MGVESRCEEELGVRLVCLRQQLLCLRATGGWSVKEQRARVPLLNLGLFVDREEYGAVADLQASVEGNS